MLKPAYSTVACPEWTLEQAAKAAGEWGWAGLELRTFGSGATQFACEPFLTATEKTRRILAAAGVAPLCLATSVRVDEKIYPPAIGRVITDMERSVRQAKRAVDLAAQIECPFVRVFGFEASERGGRKSAIERIAWRLSMALDHCRNTGVRLVLENGGSFCTATDLMEIMDKVDHPLLGAAYSMPVAHAAGENAVGGINVLGERLLIAKIRDIERGRPCPLGLGGVPCGEFVRSLASAGFDGPLVYEWDRAWLEGLDAPERVLPEAVKTIYRWVGEASGRSHPATGTMPVRRAAPVLPA
jgi:sugar phosphate isomerase/epimerase